MAAQGIRVEVQGWGPRIQWLAHMDLVRKKCAEHDKKIPKYATEEYRMKAYFKRHIYLDSNYLDSDDELVMVVKYEGKKS